MIIESIAMLWAFLVLGVIGLGPAFWFLSSRERALRYALAIAPALGFALIAIIGFPLYRFVAPVRVWALPVSLLLAIGSLALVFRELKTRQPLEELRDNWRLALLPAAFVAVCYVILLSPLVLNGIQYAIFRSNPSDAFYYMTLAETARVVDWHTLLQGATFDVSNIDGMKKLAEISPTALFNARLLTRVSQLNEPIILAWSAQISGVSIFRFYYAFHLLALALTLPLSIAIGDLLGLPKPLKYLGAAAIMLGFWTKFVLEIDAGAENSTVPLFLLFVFAWLHLEQHPNGPISPARLFLAIAGSSLILVYFPIAPIIIVAFVSYYSLGIVLREKKISAPLYHLATLLFIIAILTMTGQADDQIRTVRYAIGNVDVQRQFPPDVFNLIRGDGLGALWGLPRSILFDGLFQIARGAMRRISDAYGILLTLLVVVGAVLQLKRASPLAERIVYSVLFGGAIVALLALLDDNARAAGKAVTYVQPYLVLAVLIATSHLSEIRARWFKFAIVGIVSIWLLLDVSFGAYVPYIVPPKGIFAQSNAWKPEQYDLAPILGYLSQNRPHQILVFVPRTKSWTFAYYSTFVFDELPSYFQSGLVIDNSTSYKNLWLQDPPGTPDYAVVLKSVDYIGPQNLGAKVAETADLALYRITTQNIEAFNERETAYRQIDEAKPSHPSQR